MFKILKKYPQVKLGLSTKVDGPIELGLVPENTTKNRKRFLTKINSSKTARSLQSHSSVTRLVSKSGKFEADSLVTTAKGLALTVTVADCLPIYFFDPVQNVIAIAHSGWRGTVKGIAKNTIKVMKSNPKDVLVAVGPGIQACHFEIQKDILDNFKNYPQGIIKKSKKIYINLPKIIKSQLEALGVKPKNIEISKICTYCEKDTYFSFRRDKPKAVEAMLAYISLN